MHEARIQKNSLVTEKWIFSESLFIQTKAFCLKNDQKHAAKEWGLKYGGNNNNENGWGFFHAKRICLFPFRKGHFYLDHSCILFLFFPFPWIFEREKFSSEGKWNILKQVCSVKVFSLGTSKTYLYIFEDLMLYVTNFYFKSEIFNVIYFRS